MAAEAIVSTVLKQLALIVGKEVVQGVRIVVDVGKEIEKLTSNFEAIQAVLVDAEHKAVLVDAEQRQVKETAVGVWLDKLKDASYDMDDVLDEWNTEVLELQIEGDANAQFWKNVCFLFSYPCFCFRQITLRHDIGVKIKEMNENLDSIAELKVRYNLNETRSIEKPQKLETTFFIEVSDICGRDNDKNKLVNMLLSEGNEALPVFSIVGMGGIGKTTLAQLACKDATIKSKFNEIIWVCVSDPFNEIRIARDIIEGFTGRAPNLVKFQALLVRLGEIVKHENKKNKNFLLILDDVWEEKDDKWKALYCSLKDGFHGGSRILVTTRNERVARMMKSIDVIDIGVLSPDDSWWLFKQFAFYDRSEKECEKLEKIGRGIVVKCKGLPLAIKTIGSLLRSTKTREQWQKILESEIWKLKGLEGLFPPLLLSYNVLPFWVKRCFSYCAIFPKDYEMRKNELIELWMAQGYFDLECDEELEIIGEECFDTLAMHSFFQEFKKDDDGNIVVCKMHDIVHDFAQFLVKNECFSKEIYGGEEASLDVYCENARHSMLILKSSFNVNISRAQKLRSLLIECRYESPSMSSFSQLTCLRSLKLSGRWVNVILSEIGKLIHLRYLNMSKLNIKELPETMCCLYNLQTLNISDCESLEKLPKGMGKLINLRHLINRGTVELKYMPKEIERLDRLRTLDRFIVGGDPNGMGLGCLKNLNNLRGRLELEGLGEVVDEAEAVDAQLMNKKNLVELKLDFSGGSEISSAEESNKDSAVLEALQPTHNLEILSIKGCRSISLSPRWMISLTLLKSLSLSCPKLKSLPDHLLHCTSLERLTIWDGNCEYLPALGKLPRLEFLLVGGMKSVKRVGNEFVGIETSSSSSSSPSLIAFPKLKTLCFQEMENWEEWEYEITAGDITIMPSLSHLQILLCPKLKSLPDHLLHATTLKTLDFSWSDILAQVYGWRKGRMVKRK